MMRTVLLVLGLAIAGHFAGSSAQIRVPLRLEESPQPLPGRILLCDKGTKCGLDPDVRSKVGSNPLLVRVSRNGKDFRLLADTNQNGSLADSKPIRLTNSGSVSILVHKRGAGKRYAVLPYDVVHEPPEGDSKTDHFVLRPRYVGAGTLAMGKCRSRISLVDMDLDGRFSLADSDAGSNLRIDRNGDGRFWGKEEHVRSAEIVEYCGQNLLVASLTNRLLVLRPTKLKVAKVDEPVPGFSIALLTGRTISSDNLKGNAYVLDFWASWCAPCVKNLPQIVSIRKQYRSVSVFSVNVDRRARAGTARKIIDGAGMFDFSAIRGLGSSDPLWKTFGSSAGNRLAIPLYVLVDKDSKVRYAGSGGDGLVELKVAIDRLLGTE